MMNIISRGAEAILIKENDLIIKKRIRKNYRINEIDQKIRKFRTRSEAKILKKIEFAPKVYDFNDDEMEIRMEFIDGKLVRDVLDDISAEDRKKLCVEIGEKIGKMHDLDVIHGDLTTSNFIFKNKVYFIDFGLGFISKRIEDKATDLRLLRQALESKHYKHFDESYKNVIDGYKNSKDSKKIIEWLEKKVEKRGRYKRKERKNGILNMSKS